MYRFENRVAVITGAAGGIGLAVARALAAEGAKLALADLDWPALEAVVQELRLGVVQPFHYQLDVTNQAQVAAFFAEVVSRFGRVDVVVPCAGIWKLSTIEEMTEAQWDNTLNVNLKGTFFCCQAAIPIMKQAGEGAIVTVASAAGEMGSAFPCTHYAASKAAVIGFSKSLAREVAAHGIRVNVVSPGPVNTVMFDVTGPQGRNQASAGTLLRRMGQPEEVAHAIVSLADSRASFITGAVLRVNGGLLM